MSHGDPTKSDAKRIADMFPQVAAEHERAAHGAATASLIDWFGIVSSRQSRRSACQDPG
jgi:hypothetical protein